jgi:hypothetical protein
MTFSRFIIVLLTGLMIQVNPVMAESDHENKWPEKNDANSSQVHNEEIWGDPENDETESPWTWFGMGYELRSRRENSSSKILTTDSEDSLPSGGRIHKQK